MGSLALCSEPDHLAQLSINNLLNKHSDIIMFTARFTIFCMLATSPTSQSLTTLSRNFTKVIIT